MEMQINTDVSRIHSIVSVTLFYHHANLISIQSLVMLHVALSEIKTKTKQKKPERKQALMIGFAQSQSNATLAFMLLISCYKEMSIKPYFFSL